MRTGEVGRGQSGCLASVSVPNEATPAGRAASARCQHVAPGPARSSVCPNRCQRIQAKCAPSTDPAAIAATKAVIAPSTAKLRSRYCSGLQSDQHGRQAEAPRTTGTRPSCRIGRMHQRRHDNSADDATFPCSIGEVPSRSRHHARRECIDKAGAFGAGTVTIRYSTDGDADHRSANTRSAAFSVRLETESRLPVRDPRVQIAA